MFNECLKYKNIFLHSHFLIIAIALAFWIPTWFLPSQFGFNSENEGYIYTDLDQYNTITFITYPINLNKMSDVRRYNITFSSMLSLSKFTKLIIFEQQSKKEYHNKLLKTLTNNFNEKRISFISSDEQLNQDSQIFLSNFSSVAISKVRTKFACYINANIVVDPFWFDRIMNLFTTFFAMDQNSHIYVTGRRIQVPLTEDDIKTFTTLPSTTHKNFFKLLRKLIRSKKAEAKCIKQCESDYFIVTVDPYPFDLRYLPEFKLTGGFYSMYLNYLAENKENTINANQEVPVYYIGSLPNIYDKKFIEDSQYNYDIIVNNSFHITKNIELTGAYNGKTFYNKWNEIEINESSLTPFLSSINCSDQSDMANITLTSYSKVDNHFLQNNDQNNGGNFGFDNEQIQNEGNNNHTEGDEKNDKDESKKNSEESNKDEKEKKSNNEEYQTRMKESIEKDDLNEINKKKEKDKDEESNETNKKKKENENM